MEKVANAGRGTERHRENPLAPCTALVLLVH